MANFKKPSQYILPFLDVLVIRRKDHFLTSVYRKPAFPASYLKWNAFAPLKRKISLIEVLTHRAMHICSSSTLTDELNNIRKIFNDNGYPATVVEQTIRRKLSSHKEPVHGPKKDAVYLKLPYKGPRSEKFSNSIKS